jgi:hypothetical protein
MQVGTANAAGRQPNADLPGCRRFNLCLFNPQILGLMNDDGAHDFLHPEWLDNVIDNI